MKKSVFFAIAVVFSFQMTAQKSLNLKLASKDQQQLQTSKTMGDSSQPINFTVNSALSIATWEMPEDSSGNSTLNHFNLYLDGAFVAEVVAEERSYFYDCLDYYTEYIVGISAAYDWGETEIVEQDFISSFLFAPRNLSATSTYGDDAVIFEFDVPLNCDGEIPDGLLGFSIYKDWFYYGNITYDPQITRYSNSINNLVPGTYFFGVSAIYDLTSYGFPGEVGSTPIHEVEVEVVWGFELPFSENWNSGSFETNDWTTTSSNWKINLGEGNSSPSAEFSSDPKSESKRYTYSLTSTPFDSYMLTVGDIWLDFDLKLDDINEGSTEKLWIRVSNGLSWHLIYTRKNEGSFDWERIHLNISNLAMGNVFQVRFEASGENSSNIQKWMIDNIDVYRTCPSACSLALEIDTVGYDEYTLHFTWEPCDSIAPPNNWIHWDNGTNFTGVGTDCDCALSVAARWPANTFPEYQGTEITKVRVFAYDEGYTSWVIKIWSGENADSLVYTEDVTNQIIAGDWTEITLATPIPYNITKELWVGYSCAQLNGYFPFGADSGPAVVGYGDKITLDGTSWENLSDYGMNYNWNIQAYVEDSTGNEKSLSNQSKNDSRDMFGINIYRSVDGGDFDFFAEVPYIYGQNEYDLTSVGASDQLFCYKFTYFYNISNDYCVSAPFTTEDPNIDYVCVLLTGKEKIKAENPSSINIFPNPVTSQLNIQSEVGIEEITLVNAFGQVVFSKQINDAQTMLNTSSFNFGIYFIKIKTQKGVVNKKIVINQ
ncbi:MAG TPA: T9SS type A sorting domain-containing protein [Bacteroidales bacterium]